ncbi:hypothetical protein D5400_11685 [Georhizobium profundi]|uniref:Uncharacterized protein n=1 Tax=Georhizobium profundi TaxID=2341112 RepID=A0A3S9B4J6_9HYPH|nr:hypothetical protein [Georhizobium profundi]AZN71849.1 hypothetical protein D5400_11685 [Georhizobium profundi]
MIPYTLSALILVFGGGFAWWFASDRFPGWFARQLSNQVDRSPAARRPSADGIYTFTIEELQEHNRSLIYSIGHQISPLIGIAAVLVFGAILSNFTDFPPPMP